MIFNLTTRRNSVHLAWLLLLVPPLAGFVVDWPNDNPPLFIAVAIRLTFVLALVLPLVWSRNDGVRGRMQRLLKELMTLLPGFLIAVLVPGLLALHDDKEIAGLLVAAFGGGCLLMGASVFGSEFEQRTIAGLLSQPLSRRVLFLEKVGTLGLMLMFATVHLLLCLLPDPRSPINDGEALKMLAIPLFVFCSAPLFSLLTRSTLAGVVFTLTMPFVLWLGTTLAVQKVLWLFPLGLSSEDGLPWLPWISVPVYLLATAMLGWRAFRDLEVRDGGAGGRSTTGLHSLSLPMDALLGRLSPSMGGAGRLLRKELRLHVVPWLVACLMVVLWVLWMAMRRFTTDERLRSTLDEAAILAFFMGMFGALIVLATGAASVAEERELGTLEWQLTQPASVRRQWWTKVAVVGVLSVVLGVILPAVLVFLGFDRERLGATFGTMKPVACWAFAGIFLLVGATSVYASSFSRNTMTAVAAAVGIGAVLGGMFYANAKATITSLADAITSARMAWEASPVPVVAPAWSPSEEGVVNFGIALIAVSMLVPFVGLLWMGMRNFRTVGASGATIARQMAVTIAVCLVIGWGGAKELGRRVLLQQQASWVDEMVHRRTAAIRTAKSLADAGRLTPEVFQKYGLPTDASPASLVDAVISKDGPAAADRIGALVDKATYENLRGVNGKAYERYRMDPILARRYGLIPRGPTNTAESRTNLPAASTNPPTLKMDPEMMKRYGLQPRPSP